MTVGAIDYSSIRLLITQPVGLQELCTPLQGLNHSLVSVLGCSLHALIGRCNRHQAVQAYDTAVADFVDGILQHSLAQPEASLHWTGSSSVFTSKLASPIGAHMLFRLHLRVYSYCSSARGHCC